MRPTIPALTGLRFCAALFVVLHHFGQLIDYPPFLRQLFSHGAAGVTLFFVLSGFVLTYNYCDRFRHGLAGYREFLWARAARIGPMHLVAHLLITPVTLYILILYPIVPAGAVAFSWLAHALLVQNYVPQSGVYIWNTPSWSLCDEAFFYLLLPLLILGTFWCRSGDAGRPCGWPLGRN